MLATIPVQMKSFEIRQIIPTKDNSVKLVGEILNGEKIEPSTFICFEPENQDYYFRIIYWENNSYNSFLEISKSDFKTIENRNLIGHTFPIKKALRGADFTLAASYGAGISWWAPMILLIIVGLMFWLAIMWDLNKL